MLRLTVFIILLSMTTIVHGVETTGHLEVLSKDDQLIVGETYRAKLILAPFDKRLLVANQLENKSFLDFFYITSLRKVKISPNNVDATEIDLNLVLVKEFEPREFYLFQLEDRNIPIQLKKITTQNVTLNIKDFLIMENSLVDNKESTWKWAILFLIISIVTLSTLYFKYFRRKGNSKPELVDISFLTKVNTHQELEELYRKREAFYKLLPEEGKSKLVEVVSRYSNDQFKKEWANMDISNLCSEINKIGKEEQHGV